MPHNSPLESERLPSQAAPPERLQPARDDTAVEGFESAQRLRSLLSRRRLLFGGTAAAATAITARSARAQSAPTRARWLADRITFGATAADRALADQLDYTAYLEYQLNYSAIDDALTDLRLVPYRTLTLPARDLFGVYSGVQCRAELVEAAILRACFSTRQLYERMVEFWGDHFNIDCTKGACEYLTTTHDREVIRPNALGTFPAMLNACAHSPAMIQYLDGELNQAGNVNENYARELMELHTLGSEGGYTQQDVENVARCFTGWTYWDLDNGPDTWTFRFRAEQHDDGEKWVLGRRIPAGGGINDALSVLNLLATHPSTALHIATKLCRRFFGDDPPADVVNAVRDTYIQTGGDIKQMLRVLFSAAGPDDAAPKYKRPFHLFASAVRSVGMTPMALNYYSYYLRYVGHLPFYWSAPDGYPDTYDKWVGAMLWRWNFLAMTAGNYLGGLNYDDAVFFAGATTPDQVMSIIDNRIFGGVMDPADRARIRDYVQNGSASFDQKKRDALGLALSTPQFQWH